MPPQRWQPPPPRTNSGGSRSTGAETHRIRTFEKPYASI